MIGKTRPKPASRVAPKQPDGEPLLFVFRFYEAAVRDLTQPASTSANATASAAPNAPRFKLFSAHCPELAQGKGASADCHPSHKGRNIKTKGDHSAHHPTGTATGATSATSAADMADCKVRKIDKVAGKFTLEDGEINNLDMPGMTRLFQAKEPVLLDHVKVGDKLKFRAEKSGTTCVVTAISAANHPRPRGAAPVSSGVDEDQGCCRGGA